MENSTTIPAPVSWLPSTFWDGNDGLWNSFILSAGSPAQSFRVFPSTAGQETWLPGPAGCDTVDPSDPGSCGYLRGTLPVNGVNSSGFENNQSTTWNVNGIFSLNSPQINLGYDPAGYYGFDVVTLGNGSSAAVLSLPNQVVASVPALDFWTGYFGLGPKAINFSSFNDPVPCFMRDLVTQDRIPSLSWGYTAGAHYRDNASASLTLGGYDKMRFVDTNLSIAMNQDNSRPLQAALEAITVENTLCGTASNLQLDQTFHFIDSTVPHIWLPNDVVDRFVNCFGLIYDNSTDLFLVNDTVRSQLLNLNPTFTFTFSNGTAESIENAVNVELPYAAFDLQASYPYYQVPTNYFPIRRAANNTQYTIGRTLLQEAYVIADFERSNFTIAQASFDNIDAQNLVAIRTVSSSPSSNTSSSSSSASGSKSLGGGAIAGIVVGVIVAIAIIGGLVFFLIRQRRRKSTQESLMDYAAMTELPHDGRQRAEMPSEHALTELPQPDESSADGLRPPSARVEVEGSLGAHELLAPFKR
nr:hypothetical protein CFP56_12869 [Quercus suber]